MTIIILVLLVIVRHDNMRLGSRHISIAYDATDNNK